MEAGNRTSALPFAGISLLTAILLLSLCSWVHGAGLPAPDGSHEWSHKEQEVLRSLWLGSLPPPPKDPTNAYADNPQARKLGERFFFDKRFSKNGKVSCGTCHRKSYNFTEEMPRAQGVGPTERRTPHLIGMAYLPWFFWDGRADSLWAQALGPMESPVEHGITRTFCARLVSEHYKQEYEAVFGPLPDLPPDVCIPIARPAPDDEEGYRAWTAIPVSKRDAISRVYVNIGKAIAAYEREILPGPAKFDRYVETVLKKDRAAMHRTFDQAEAEGLRLFIGKAGCVKCHSGPLFTNGEFRRTGVYQPADLPEDTGRAAGIGKLLASEFNCLGKYSDGRREDCSRLLTLNTTNREQTGAFRVPSLRNVADRPPYMHAGQYWSLWEVLRFYARKRVDPGLSPELLKSGLTENETANLEAFLMTLSGPLSFPDSGLAETGGEHRHGQPGPTPRVDR
jgi:cytochrome c peroxidase